MNHKKNQIMLLIDSASDKNRHIIVFIILCFFSPKMTIRNSEDDRGYDLSRMGLCVLRTHLTEIMKSL